MVCILLAPFLQNWYFPFNFFLCVQIVLLLDKERNVFPSFFLYFFSMSFFLPHFKSRVIEISFYLFVWRCIAELYFVFSYHLNSYLFVANFPQIFTIQEKHYLLYVSLSFHILCVCAAFYFLFELFVCCLHHTYIKVHIIFY